MRYLISHSVTRKSSASLGVWALTLLLALFLQTSSALAQDDAFEEGLDWTSPSMKSDVKGRVEGSLRDLRQQVDQMAPKIERFAEENFRSGSHSVNGEQYDEMPKRHPMLDSQGIADTSKEDYVKKDTRVLFNPETFAQCHEERQVTAGPYVEECRRRCTPGWVTYTGEKATSCIPCNQRCIPGMPGCVPCKFNQFYVSEMYWPVYESRTYPGRAMGSFDPNAGYLHGQDKQQALEFEKVREESYDRFITYMKKWYKDTYDSNISEGELREAFPRDLYLAGDFTGRDLNVSDNDGHTETHSNHTLVYMTNANRQLSRRMRPSTDDNWKGYIMEDKCFFNTLPDPSKRAVSHASYHEGHDELTFQYNHQKVNEPDGVKPRGSAYGHAMLNEGPQVYNLLRQVDQELRASPFQQPAQTIDSMLGQYIEMNQQYFGPGMERLGSELHTHYQDWLYHNFFRLYHSRNSNLMEDPLYASIVSGFSFYTLNSLPTFNPNMTDDGERRPILWSFWAGRPGMDGKNYAGSKKVGPGKIFSVDKMQVIYPTIDDKDLGSQCFRPESLARSEYFDPQKQSIDDTAGSGGFWGFRRDLNKRLLDEGIKEAHNYVREVRIAYWIKRVNCHCTICASGGFLGCSVLNTGDHPDDWFYGTRSLENQRPQLTPGTILRSPDTEFRMIGPGASLLNRDADTLKKTPQESEDEAFISNVSYDSTEKPESESAASSEWQPAPVNPNQPAYGDYTISPFDDYYQPYLRRVSDKPLIPKRIPRNAATSVKKVQQGPYEDNARKIGLRRYGGHALDDKAAEPQKEGNGDQFEIGIQSQTGTPGPVNAVAENYLANADAGDDKPANTGGPVPLPPGSFDPPSPAPVAPLVFCPLPSTELCPGCPGRTLSRSDFSSPLRLSSDGTPIPGQGVQLARLGR